MSGWKTHVIAGFILTIPAAIALKYFFHWFPLDLILLAQMLCVIFIGALAPDLDHENGWLHNTIIMIGLIIAVAGIYWKIDAWIFVGVMMAASAFFVAKFAHHRGIIHSIPFCILVGIAFAIFLKDAQLGVLGAISSWSHLMMDGIPLKMH